MDNRGISIIEAVVAVVILSLTMITIQTLNVYNIKSDQLNTSQIVADNLAKEGIEAVRNIRDSNWQRYSGNIRSNNTDGSGDHWNDGFDGTDSFGFTYNTQLNDSTYNPSNGSDVQYYFVPELIFDSNDPNEQYTWNLRFADSVNTFDESDDVLANIITNESTGIYQVHLDPTTLMYVQAEGIDTVQYPQTQFYRVVEITYEESYDQVTNCTPGTTADCKLNAHDNSISIRSIVAWKDTNDTIKYTSINSKLTDWYQRIDKK
jgi:type II secretory pathway pseudopilin PulG